MHGKYLTNDDDSILIYISVKWVIVVLEYFLLLVLVDDVPSIESVLSSDTTHILIAVALPTSTSRLR